MTMMATTQAGVGAAELDEENWAWSSPTARAPAQFFPEQLDPEKVM